MALGVLMALAIRRDSAAPNAIDRGPATAGKAAPRVVVAETTSIEAGWTPST